jgi:steroid 5-alpha reductase family enzyme
MSTLEIFLITLGFTFILIYWIWIWAVKIENFSIIDAAWSGAFFIHCVIFFGLSYGYTFRKMIFLAMMGLWSIRLAYFLTKRISSHHPQEDTRYAQLRAEYGASYKKRFLYFFMMQAVSISFLTLPAIFVFNNMNESLHILEYLGLFLFAVSLAGESIADQQMNAFKSNPANKGKVCNVGLWKYSRHPNYFFESCIWFSFYVFMLATPGLWWAIYAPLTILFLLLKVTGVPPSESQSLKSRGDAYREYQQKTSVFFPWFPKP